MVVVLRPYRLDDASAIAAWGRDVETTRWMGPRFREPRTVEVVRKRLEDLLRSPPDDGAFFVVADPKTGAYLGAADLTSIDRVDRRAVLSLVIARAEDRGQGRGTEALRLLLDHAFGPLALNKVELRVNAANAAALRCYQKAGFRIEGRLRDHSVVDGRLDDMLCLGLLASERTSFVPGLDLAEAFYREAVGPLLADGFPSLKHTAGLVGAGSEVLGFDTAQSADHHWGPRVMVFVEDQDLGRREEIARFLARRLPPTFRGWSTHWGPPDEIGVRLLAPAVPGEPISHRVEVDSLAGYLRGYLGVDPSGPLSDAEWLVPGDQKWRTLRYGRLFRDDLGFQEIRDRIAWYPEPVWREKMARLWDRIADEEPFVGRCLAVGDPMGSRLIAARLTELSLQLAFLQEREFPPYSKWFGTALSRLVQGAEWGLLADAVLGAEDAGLEEALGNLLSAAARGHNGLKLTPPLGETPSPFWSRPYRVIHGDRFAVALRNSASAR